MTKERRQAAILRLIRTHRVETQEELVELLEKEGIPATQATVSRDIKELRLIKVKAGDGNSYYAVAPNTSAGDLVQRARRAFQDYVIHMDWTGNLVVLRCLSGTASTISQLLDDLKWDEVTATLAGDDTVLVIVKRPEEEGALPEWEPLRTVYRRLQELREPTA
ncbi:MAG: arginine repressor [Limnochordales bacterium]|nr:arginine repressor [Limnochordales bacterium]